LYPYRCRIWWISTAYCSSVRRTSVAMRAVNSMLSSSKPPMTMLLFPISIANIICKSSVSLTGQVVIAKILPARTAHAQHFNEHLAHRGGDDSGDNRLGDAVCSDDAQNRLVDQVGGNLFGGAPSLPEQQ